jgi:hypothetical protein
MLPDGGRGEYNIPVVALPEIVTRVGCLVQAIGVCKVTPTGPPIGLASQLHTSALLGRLP